MIEDEERLVIGFEGQLIDLELDGVGCVPVNACQVFGDFFLGYIRFDCFDSPK